MATQPSHSIDLVWQAEVAAELATAAQQAQSATHASGAAIAVQEANEFFCRASSGPNAPDVGAAVRVEGTFTGICIESGKELLCDDAETDARVDINAVRALGIRSILIMPITEQKRVSGLLAVFATMPHAFNNVHIAALKVLADQVSAILQKERGTFPGEHIEPPVRPAPPVLKMVTSTTADHGTEEETGRTLVPSDNLAAKNVANDKDRSEAGLFTFTLSGGAPPRHKFEPAAALKHSLEAIGAVSTKLARAARNKLTAVGIVAAALAAVLGVTVLLRSSNRGPSTPVQVLQHEQQNLIPSQPDGVQAANVFTTAKPDRVENNENRFAGKKSEQPESYQKPSAVSVAGLKIPRRPLLSHAQPEDVAPNLNIGPSPASDLALLAQPANGMRAAVASSSDLVKARLIHVVSPIYPNIAKTNRVSGAVVLEIVVEKDGKVTNPKFIKGPVVLRGAAFDAVKQWIFQPAMLDGHPIDQKTRVTLNFRPDAY